MKMPRHLAAAALGTLVLIASPASATRYTVTLTGNTEAVHDNVNVFGYGTGQLLTDKSFVETFLVDTSAVNAFGPQTATGVSSNSIFGGSPPYAVGGVLTIDGHSFATTGSNYSSVFTAGDYSITSNDQVNSSVDNNFYVDLTGAGLPTTVAQTIALALTPSQVANVSFIDNNSAGYYSDAIGNLYPTQLTVALAPGAVPEPGAWSMMILGFAAIGGMVRRTGKHRYLVRLCGRRRLR